MNSAGTTEGLGQDVQRQRIVDRLSEHYANGALEVEEFERRVEQAERATTPDELARLVHDLDPFFHLPATEPVEAYPTVRDRVTLPVRAGDAPRRRAIVSFFSKLRRGHGWQVPRRLRVVAVLGGVELDLRDAVFGPGVTEVQVMTSMGNVRIIVPPGTPVAVEGTGLMGRFHDYRDPSQRAAGAPPVLRITGLALMGSVKLQVWLPGETPHDAARRMHQERRERAWARRG